MAVGSAEPAAVRRAITVEGISCTEAVFKSANMHISSEARDLSGFSFCSSSMARRPNGVAALLMPKMFAVIFDVMACMAELLGSSFGKSMRVTGRRSSVTNESAPLFSAISISPEKKHIVPQSSMQSLIPSAAPLSAAAETASVFPVKKDVTIAASIRNGQT